MAPAPAVDVFKRELPCRSTTCRWSPSRITVRPGWSRCRGRGGLGDSRGGFDALIFGTGYALDVPFLDDATRGADVADLRIDPQVHVPSRPQRLCLCRAVPRSVLFSRSWAAGTVARLRLERAVRRPSDAGARRCRRVMCAPAPAGRRCTRPRGSSPARPASSVAAWPDLTRPAVRAVGARVVSASGRDSLPDAAARVLSEATAFG